MLTNPWVYFTKHPFDLYDQDESSVEVTAISLCKTEDVIAIATSNGRISFFNADGEKHPTLTDIASKESYYCQLIWKFHGDKQLIGGRADGQIFSWVKDDDVDSQRAYAIDSNRFVHKDRIRNLCFNDAKSDDSEERLLSIDHAGYCCIWNTEEHELVPVMKIDSGIKIASFTFLPDVEEFCTSRTSSFLLGSTDGKIFHFDERGKRQQIHSENNFDTIDHVLCDVGTNNVVVLSRALTCFQFSFERDGSIVEKNRRTLDIDGFEAESFEEPLRNVILTNAGQLVALTAKGVVQSWDLRYDESYILNPASEEGSKFDPAISITYSSDYDVLAFGTQGGRCTFWKEARPNDNVSIVDSPHRHHIHASAKWINIFDCDLTGYCSPDNIIFGKTILIQSSGSMLSLKQDWLLSVHKHGKAALQIDQESVVIFHDFSEKPTAILDTGMGIVGLAIDSQSVCVWSHQEIQVYSIESRKCTIFSEIGLSLQTLTIVGESLYIAQGRCIIITDLYGAQKLTIRLPEDEGCPQHLDTTSTRLIIYTDIGTLKIMDITKKEPRLLFSKQNAFDDFDFASNSILSVHSNADCSLLSIVSIDRNDDSRRRLFFYDMKSYACSSLDSVIDNEDSEVSLCCWDPAEPKSVLCEMRSRNSMVPKILTLFIGINAEPFVHSDYDLDSWRSTAIGFSIPSVFTLKRTQDYPSLMLSPETYEFVSETMKGFETFSDIQNSELISAATDFFFYISSKDIDRAFICAALVKENELWYKLISFCVNKGSLDVAKKCLAEMKKYDAVASVRDAEKNPEIEVALAQVAIEVGMMEEAEKLYVKCQRKDLLCNLFRHQEKWPEAFEVAGNDALLNKSLHFHYGKWSEQNGDDENAFNEYKMSSFSGSKTMLRKMIEKEFPVDDYLRQTNSTELISLHASYFERNGDIPRAETLYSTADDNLSLIRIACAKGDLDDAFELARRGCKAGAYHLARHLEAQGDLSGALTCYSMSGMYNYAIRLCKLNDGFDTELMNFAMKSQTPQVLSCAHHFAQKGEIEKAARLFIQGDDKAKALDILSDIPLNEDNFNANSEYASLIEELDISVSGEILQKYAKFLVRAGDKERSLTILKSKGFSIADILDHCAEQNIILDEDLSKIILSQDADVETLTEFANLCKSQGNYTLACKKFTEAGDKTNAMKALLQTGDIQTIIKYASASRSKNVYILAANHLQKLQTHDHTEDPKIKKTMVQFYTKAKAYQQLVSLLVEWCDCDTIEGDYERAIKWLNEARKYGEKIVQWNSSQEYLQIEENRKIIDGFLSARDNSSIDPGHARDICFSLLKSKKEHPIQLGDCYALLLELEDDDAKAYTYIKEMSDAGIVPEEYIDEETIISVHKAVNVTWQGSSDEVDSLSQDQSKESEDSMESSGILVLDAKDQEILGFAKEREWAPVRDLIDKCGSELSHKVVCCLFSTGPPQSVAVSIMRANADLFATKDEIGRYPLHYLCYYGAPTYTIIFTIQRYKNALQERDEDGKTPTDHVLTSHWEHCIEDQKEVVDHLRKS